MPDSISTTIDKFIHSNTVAINNMESAIDTQRFLDKDAPSYSQKKVDNVFKNIVASKENYTSKMNKHKNSLSVGQTEAFHRLINKTDKIASRLSGQVSNSLAPTYLSPVAEGVRKSRKGHRKSRKGHKKSRKIRKTRRHRK